LIKAVDTCVLARVIARDDPHQLALAEDALAQQIFVSLTVILETSWLLTSRYRLPRLEVVESLTDILSAPNVHCEHANLVSWALDRFANGASIGDMMHLVAASRQTAFFTFDKSMTNEAGPNCPVPIEILS
jgi:predicted nucleic-acid-binding protein